MISIGIVTQLDPSKHRARVRFPDMDSDVSIAQPGMESYWLPVVTQWSLGAKSYCMPTVGEQVACWMDEEFAFGVIIGGIYSDADTPPAAPATSRHQVYPDGTIIEYDPASHVLKVDVKGDVTIIATGNVTATITGNLSATANNATITAASLAKIKGATITLDGPVTVTGLLLVQGLATLSAGVVFGGTATVSGGGAWSFTGSATFSGDLGAAAVNATGAVDSITGVTKAGAPYNFP